MIHALIVAAVTMIGISGVGLIRAVVPLGRSQCCMDLITQHSPIQQNAVFVFHMA